VFNELSYYQMKIKKVHSINPNDLPAFVKAGNLDTMFGFCSLCMVYEEIGDYKSLEKKFKMCSEKNVHLFNNDNVLKLMIRGDRVRDKVIRLKSEQIPNAGVQELINLVSDINMLEQEYSDNDMFKTFKSMKKELITFKNVTLDFNRSEIVLEIEPVIRYSESKLYDRLLEIIRNHQYSVEKYPEVGHLVGSGFLEDVAAVR